jgi:hypothetical protein
MSRLRKLCDSSKPALATLDVLYVVRQSLLRRRGLISGTLHDGLGHHCAMGCAWADNPAMVVNGDLVDEVAAVNDLRPWEGRFDRWKRVRAWLDWRIEQELRIRSR